MYFSYLQEKSMIVIYEILLAVPWEGRTWCRIQCPLVYNTRSNDFLVSQVQYYSKSTVTDDFTSSLKILKGVGNGENKEKVTTKFRWHRLRYKTVAKGLRLGICDLRLPEILVPALPLVTWVTIGCHLTSGTESAHLQNEGGSRWPLSLLPILKFSFFLLLMMIKTKVQIFQVFLAVLKFCEEFQFLPNQKNIGDYNFPLEGLKYWGMTRVSCQWKRVHLFKKLI